MGNCVSKIPLSIISRVDHVKGLLKDFYTQRYIPTNNMIMSYMHNISMEIATPVADRFPKQSCVLEYKKYANANIGRDGKGQTRKYLELAR